MIDLYTWSTPNGRKAAIMLEETHLDYNVNPINIGKDEQFTPQFLAISPNNKIPAIIDTDGPGGKPISVFESGAILLYLAEKVGSDLLPIDPREKVRAIEWLMFQMGGVGPMFGQAHHFFRGKEDVPYGKKRYFNETQRLYTVMDKRLDQNLYLAGDSYTIADVATFPWVARFEWHKTDLKNFPNVKRWFDAVSDREPVKKGMAVL